MRFNNFWRVLLAAGLLTAPLVHGVESESLEGQEESLILGNKIPQDEAGLWALPRAEVNLDASTAVIHGDTSAHRSLVARARKAKTAKTTKTKKPTTPKKPKTKKPTTPKKPKTKRPTTPKKPKTKKPTTPKKPKSKKPETKKPTPAKKPTTKKPETKKPTPAKKPKTKKPTATATPTSTAAASCKRTELSTGKSTKNTKGTKSTTKRALGKRANTKALQGQTVTGGPSDRVWTDSLDTCIGLVAIGPNGDKVLTHAGPATFTTDYQSFKTAANALGAGTTVSASFPPDSQGGAGLAPLLANLKKTMRTNLNRDFSRSSGKVSTRNAPATGREGARVSVGNISVEGGAAGSPARIFINECPGNPV